GCALVSPAAAGMAAPKVKQDMAPPGGYGPVDYKRHLPRQRELGTEHKEVICRTPKPQTAKELQTFLGMTGWCCLWIYNYGLMVKPLCDLIKINQSKLVWPGEAQKIFEQLKQELVILKYQAILVDQDDVEIVVTNIVNPG
uniref:NADH dehydrogenase [ubiquinone] 1 alpha subcomplex subunit 13 n=1 Tax=Anas platyrhynchos platyrhynchos TaxID=8840 RepID=A0A493TPM4_ANAPP